MNGPANCVDRVCRVGWEDILDAEVDCDDGYCFLREACGVRSLLRPSEATRMMERLGAIDFEMVWDGRLQTGLLLRTVQVSI